jgi:Domain of unknown function (DUF4386)
VRPAGGKHQDAEGRGAVSTAQRGRPGTGSIDGDPGQLHAGAVILLGLLVYRSRFLPRFLGVWLIVGCFGWLAFSFAGFLFPESGDRVFTLIQPLTFGEVATMFWLVIVGAKEQRPAVAVAKAKRDAPGRFEPVGDVSP